MTVGELKSAFGAIAAIGGAFIAALFFLDARHDPAGSATAVEIRGLQREYRAQEKIKLLYDAREQIGGPLSEPDQNRRAELVAYMAEIEREIERVRRNRAD